MIASLIIARMIVAVVLVCVPILLFVLVSGRPENALWLIFPFFGAVPAIVGALVLFLPVEVLLDSRGLSHWKNMVVPLVGFLLPIVFMIVMGRKPFADGNNLIWLIVWGVFGAFWGFAWRGTEWLARWTGLVNG